MTEKTKRKEAPQTFRQKYKFLLLAVVCIFLPPVLIYIQGIALYQLHLSTPLVLVFNLIIVAAMILSVSFFFSGIIANGEKLLQFQQIIASLSGLLLTLLSIPGILLLFVSLGFSPSREVNARVVLDERVYIINDMTGIMTTSYQGVYECVPLELFCVLVADPTVIEDWTLSPEQAEQMVLDALKRAGRQ